MVKPLKACLYVIYLLLAVVFLSEILLRIYFAFEVSPRVLAYGTSAYENTFGKDRRQQLVEEYDKEFEEWVRREELENTVYHQDREMGGYRKFFSNEEKYHRDSETGESFRIGINSRGFRGPEFKEMKPEGVIRILTLGASSTFGFFNRDHETYPSQLQNNLEKRCPDKVFEVINFAIPKSTADNIRSMLIAEGIRLRPDIMTFYEGRNDSDKTHPMDFKGGETDDESPKVTFGNLLTEKLVVFRFVDQLISAKTRHGVDSVRESLDSVASRTSREFLGDLESIRKLAEHYDIHLIIANQQASSQSWFQVPLEKRQMMKGLSYDQEAEQIHYRITQGQSISGYEFNFLIHRKLMQDLENWAVKKGLPFVDIIELLDMERDHLISYVHLDAYANGIIAESFGSAVQQHLECGIEQNSISQVD